MIKNFIFDVGKVLVDYDPFSFMEEIGLTKQEAEAVNQAMFSNPLWELGDQGAYPAEEFLPKFIEQNPVYEQAIRKAYENLGTIIHPYSYVLPWMEQLKDQGYHLYVLSNYPEFLYEKTKPRMNFLPYMEGAVFSAFEQDVKPNASIYQTLLSRYQLKPEECVFFDDRINNVEAAAALGICAIHFTGDVEKAMSQVPRQ